jgi:radical SAM protein with 4Fe4S-binding SPASM domain
LYLPYRLYLDITSACPLNCLHCYANRGENSVAELSLPELKSLAWQMLDLRISNLVISGGEPLTRVDIFDFLAFCTESGLNVTLLTSGVLLESVMAKRISGLNIELRLSLDGISEETHDYIRGKGNFKIVLEKIEMLKSINFKKLSVHFTINRINITEILQLPYFFNRIGINNIVISTIKPAGRALIHPEILIEPSLALLVKERINTISKNKFLNFHNYEEKNWQGMACPAAFAKCGITAFGNITPCIFLGKEYIGGNVRDKTLAQLWNDDEILNRIRTLPLNKDCADCCDLFEYNGGCRARAIYFNRNVSAVDPYCCERKRTKELLTDFVKSTRSMQSV